MMPHRGLYVFITFFDLIHFQVLLNSAARKQNKKRQQILMHEENGNESQDKSRSPSDSCSVLNMSKCIKLTGNLLTGKKQQNTGPKHRKIK